MSAAALATDPMPSPERRGFWHRRVVQPILAQLTQGVSPDQIARTLGVGAACSLLPFLGFTTLLNLAVGVALRMNQPILQTLNTLLAPVQLAMILVYVRAGELLWQAEGAHFTVGEMIRQFSDLSVRQFLQQFGWAGVHALTAWLISAPLLIVGVTLLARPALRRLASRRP